MITIEGTGVRELTRGLATLPQKVAPGAFNGQRQAGSDLPGGWGVQPSQ